MGIEIHDGLELWPVRQFNPDTVLRPGVYHGMSGTNAYGPGANKLIGQYWALPRAATCDRIAVSVQTPDSGKGMRLGIYADEDLDGYPDRLLLDAGTVDLGSTGTKALLIEQQLGAGLYFLALLANSATATIWMDDVPRMRSPLGLNAEPGLPTFAWQVTCGFGALPDPFPSGAAPMNDAWGIALRLKSLD